MKKFILNFLIKMSEYFGKYNRPKEEIKEINKFIKLFNKSLKEYNSKNYDIALSGFISSYEIIIDIFDTLPKVITLNFIIKLFFRNKKYNECYSYIKNMKQCIPILIEEKREYYIKYYPKIFLYEFILDFIHENLDQSILHITDFITFLKNDNILSLEEKINFFFVFLKNFIKLGENIHSRNFLFFKEQYFSMIIEEKINKKFENMNMKTEKKISTGFVSYYKCFMNSKLKDSIFEKLDNLYYSYKYGITNDKIINFLNRNIDPYVQSDEKNTLISKFENYLIITKINLKKKFNMSMNQLIFEQKRRIKYFNSIFLNIVGAFNQIFKNYYTSNEVILKPLKKSNSMSYIFNKQDILLMEQKIMNKKRTLNKETISRNPIEKQKKIINKNKSLTLRNLKKDFKVPPPDSMNLKLNKKKINDKLLFFSNIKYKTIFNRSYRVSKIVNTKSYNSNVSTNGIKDKKNIFSIVNHTKDIKELLFKKRNMQYNKLLYRRFNYFLISKFVEIYENFFNEINGKNNNINNKDKKNNHIFEDNIINLNISNCIKENSLYISNGDIKQDYFHNNCFIFKKFMLINNFYLFGLCESKGKSNEKIPKMLSILFPTYLNYLIIEYLLSKDNKDLEALILQLFKFEELAKNIKNKYLLSYLNDKFEINFRNIYSLFGDINLISNFFYESLFYIIKEFNQKYKYELIQSDLSLCSTIIVGKIIYLINIGNNSNALICYKNSNSYTDEEWGYRVLSSIKINKVIKKLSLVNNNDLNSSKEISKENINEPFIFKLNNKESLIIDSTNIKNGTIFEQQTIKYEINSNDKFIIIASFGFWKYMDLDETVNIIAEYYNKDMASDQVAKLIVEIAENKCFEEKKKKHNLYTQQGNVEYNDITCIIIYLDAK